MLMQYEAFVERVEEAGLYFLSANPWDAPNLEEESSGFSFFSDLEDPPWYWKNRIAEQRKALYGHFLGGRLQFVSTAWQSTLVAALRPQEDMQERYEQGKVDPLVLRVASEMRAMPCTTIGELRAALGLTSKEKAKLEGAVRRLEEEMFVCIGATVYKNNKQGQPYGWGSNALWLCEAYAPEAIQAAAGLSAQEARGRIMERLRELGGKPVENKLFRAR